MKKGGYVYLVTNKHLTSLYVGVTSDLAQRIYDHRNHNYRNSFTDKYNVEFLVYYELFDSITLAIDREKEIKKWRREKKDALVNKFNPEWKDLYNDIMMWR
jgi:putative endonuclease